MKRLFRDAGSPCEGMRALSPQGSVVCIGAFDGLHLGHRALAGRACQRARALGVQAVALSFEPLPREFFAGGAKPPRLMLARAKVQGLWDLGCDSVGLLRFNARLASMSAEDFVRTVLVGRLAAAGCTDRRYYQLAALHMQRAGNWTELLRLSDEALGHLPDHPHFVVTKVRAMRMLGQGAEAEALLRAAYARDPRGRAVVVALARSEQGAGRMAEAIALYEQSINLFPLGGRPAQLRKLIELCESAGARQAATRASQQLIALVPGDALAQRILAGTATD